MAKEGESGLVAVADSFSKELGLEMVRTGKGECVLSLKIAKKHLNRSGIAHGGVLLAALDTCMGASVVTTLTEGEWAATIQVNAQFLEKCVEGDSLSIEAKVLRRGKRFAFVEGAVMNSGKLACKASGEWVISSK